ncbi:MAG: CAP domain-containing protein [Acidobacteria bacterium]|nr:CAP domain-containing protein [Acidobacteriota bacterium]
MASAASGLLPSDDPYFTVRQVVVQKINEDRAAAGLGPVELDSLSSQVGDQHCQEMASNGYLSHWNLRGLLPYHRYHIAGGRDQVQENLSRMTIFSTRPNPFSTAPEDVLVNLLKAHQRFVDEKPPLDGHRKNVLDPAHTHVGIGLGVVGENFTMAEEFLNRYVELEPLPEILPRRSTEIKGLVLNKEFGPYYCVLFYEGWPQARTVDELNRTYAYEDMTGQIAARVPPWEMAFNSSSGRFRFNLSVKTLEPGYYHMVFWVRRPIRSIPYALGSFGMYQVDTAGGIPCAGWVFHAEP